ncbi:hypothetical protein HDV06_007006 [Boothiomyces sp. JEL0866]|nr:hypothetical protein HDV06_007006 [Boothiomyces sp. JEL0866]
MNDNYSLPVFIDSKQMEFANSPNPMVRRKRFELFGSQESGRVTTIVEYLPNSKFHRHPHPQGEEILVLDGIFSDETGDYPTGSYLLNPEGFVHAPYSKEGCLILVKLRQAPGTDREHIAKQTWNSEWQQFNEYQLIELHSDSKYKEEAYLIKMGGKLDLKDIAKAYTEKQLFEIFVLDGNIVFKQNLDKHCWGRMLLSQALDYVISGNGTIYIKFGHLCPDSE